MSYVLLFFTSFYYWLLVQITYIGPFTAAFSVLVYRERFHQYGLISKLSCIPNSPSTELEFGSINKSKVVCSSVHYAVCVIFSAVIINFIAAATTIKYY